MTRGGASLSQDGSERRCIVTGTVGDPDRLIRFVVGPDDVVVPDLMEKLPGRGMWLTAERSILEKAQDGKAFSRAARKKVTVPSGMATLIETSLTDRVIGFLALARKAGEAIAGYEKVKSWLESDFATILLQASDGSERGKAKLRPPGGPETLISVLSASELGRAFGRENVIHGALAGGGLTRRVVEETTRLAGLRTPIKGNTARWKD